MIFRPYDRGREGALGGVVGGLDAFLVHEGEEVWVVLEERPRERIAKVWPIEKRLFALPSRSRDAANADVRKLGAGQGAVAAGVAASVTGGVP